MVRNAYATELIDKIRHLYAICTTILRSKFSEINLSERHFPLNGLFRIKPHFKSPFGKLLNFRNCCFAENRFCYVIFFSGISRLTWL